MKENQKQMRLFAINEMIDEYLNSDIPILSKTHTFLEKIQMISLGIEEENQLIEINPILKNAITIFCASSTLEESKGPSSIGYVIDFNEPKQINITNGRFSKAITSKQAKYDAIYFSLTTLYDLSSGINIAKPINVISDDILVIQQLNGEEECDDEKLEHKRNSILSLTEEFQNTSIIFSWKPKDSTPKLLEATRMAQTLLGVKNS
jgi:hypothetical protein